MMTLAHRVVAIALTLAASQTLAQAQQPARQLLSEGVFVRETNDTPWTITLGKGVASRPGCYMIVHDASGRVLLKKQIPYKGQTDTQSLTVQVPADGITGDYRIVFVGQQDDSFSLDLPLTSLPLEVYGSTRFAANSPCPPLYFKSSKDTKSLTVSSHKGGVRVLRQGAVIADTAKPSSSTPTFAPATFSVDQEGFYQIDPYSTFYFSTDRPVFLTFDTSRWFEPQPSLVSAKWWLNSAQ